MSHFVYGFGDPCAAPQEHGVWAQIFRRLGRELNVPFLADADAFVEKFRDSAPDFLPQLYLTNSITGFTLPVEGHSSRY